MPRWTCSAAEPALTEPPFIIEFTPTSGPIGTEVTINGENLTGATAVRFADLPAAFRVGFFGTNLVATVPAGAVSGPISVVTPIGIDTSATPFVVVNSPPPIISSFNPESGPVGTAVVITGDNFNGVTAVRFNGLNAEFTPFGTTIATSVPVGASSGPITVVNAGGARTSTGVFTVTTPGAPQITDVTPLRGRPGSSVTITGENLATVTEVRFNGTVAAFSMFGTALFATVPEQATSGKITVINPKGSATSANSFEVVPALAPEITSFSPGNGAPGTAVSVLGINLQGATEVRLGGVLAASFNAVSNSELSVLVPEAAASGPITVKTPAGTAVSADNFYAPASVTSFDPTRGTVGTIVTIRGRNFTDAIAVLFGGTVTSFTTVSSEEIRATVPEGAASGEISVATPAGFATSADQFLLPPRIFRFDPRSSPALSTITISGENFLNVSSVRFGQVEAQFTPVSLGTLNAVVPAGAVNGPITVTTPAGVAVSSDTFFVGLFNDVAVGLSTSADQVGVGDFLGYSLTVTNRGSLDASDVVVTDRLPAGVQLLFSPSGADCAELNGLITCRLGTLVSGADVAIKISVVIQSGTTLTNQAAATSSGTDADLSNNNASLVTVLKGVPPSDDKVSLSAALAGRVLQLSWVDATGTYILESTSSLAAGTTWTASTAVPVVIDGRRTVQLTPPGGATFYRLRKP